MDLLTKRVLSVQSRSSISDIIFKSADTCASLRAMNNTVYYNEKRERRMCNQQLPVSQRNT